ncbi:MAG: transglycosylase domain-containing protein [Desulfobacterium sp.]|jgi:penicillin-binding protein 1C|nr:transglycosylase domain-containing protein [Desulfobacterium sp.]
MKEWFSRKRGICFFLVLSVLIAAVTLGIKTRKDMLPLPASLSELVKEVARPILVDRYDNPLTVTFTNHWNASPLNLHEIPDQLKNLFLFSEDRRFFTHRGVDWMARINALVQNLGSSGTLRGASTITEQVVRMIHPRTRSLWSKWVEGFEAIALERQNTKTAILEFYLNQVPYASNRRGVSQAALFYFNRSLDTLNLKEMMALAVLVRAPSSYDLRENSGRIQPVLERLGRSLVDQGVISPLEYERVAKADFQLEAPGLFVDAGHFARFAFQSLKSGSGSPGNEAISYMDSSPLYGTEGAPARIKTTLDAPLQSFVQTAMETRVGELQKRGVTGGGCLVVNNSNREILAWVCVGDDDSYLINSVLVPRQPGSTLKPFLYALALEKGWTAATMILDAPLSNPVGTGLHTFHNYSRRHYGPVTLRQALGNSLNIPAVKAVEFTGGEAFLSTLGNLGIQSLHRHPDFYGDGLALGNGEVSLYEMVQAYASLAGDGIFSPLVWRKDRLDDQKKTRVFPGDVASIIGNILSDSEARALEFGRGSLLNFPVETAVKTGTSNDYKDAWTLGFNHAYTVGVWMGNLDGRPMDGVTGSIGPAMVVRSLFAHLNRKGSTAPLYLSSSLIRKKVVIDNQNREHSYDEWFIPGTGPGEGQDLEACGSGDNLDESDGGFKDGVAGLGISEDLATDVRRDRIGFLQPVNGLEMAMDPRIPDSDQAFEFLLAGVEPLDRVEWFLDGNSLGVTLGGRFLWHLEPGSHLVHAHVHKPKGQDRNHRVRFKVKKGSGNSLLQPPVANRKR